MSQLRLPQPFPARPEDKGFKHPEGHPFVRAQIWQSIIEVHKELHVHKRWQRPNLDNVSNNSVSLSSDERETLIAECIKWGRDYDPVGDFIPMELLAGIFYEAWLGCGACRAVAEWLHKKDLTMPDDFACLLWLFNHGWTPDRIVQPEDVTVIRLHPSLRVYSQLGEMFA